VKAGRFREDLYYRLCVFPISVPPLRERTEDIPHLIRHFLLRFSAEEGKRVRGLSAPALATLTGFSWPGNVRQLENAIFRAVVLADGDEIGIDEFPQIAALFADQAAAETPLVPRLDADIGADAAGDGPEGLRIHSESLLAGRKDLTPGAAIALLDPAGEVVPLETLEAAAIRFAIGHYRGQMSEVARKLRIGRSTLYRKIEQLGLAPGAGKADVAGR
jgi:DNA-binding NtrC family response regulator